MEIGIFGGTFNPPHKGHTEAVEAAMNKLNFDKILIIPSFLPPHKKLSDSTPDASFRFDMARIAFQDFPNTEINDIELKRKGKSYTIDTVLELQKLYPGASISLIMGGDMYLTLLNWYRGNELVKIVRPVVVARADKETEKIKEYACVLKEKYGTDTVFIEKEIVEISSTDLRKEMKAHENLIDKKVLQYIRKWGLYGMERYDFDAFKAYNKDNLSEKRFRHVLGCEQEAVKLAERWKADVDDARAAALLHDITKELDMSTQLKLCKKYGIILDAVEKESPKLLHAKTGAAVAKDIFSIPDNIYSAILWHTTGRANMSLGECILFMADFIEPTRDFDGVDELRELAYTNLKVAMIRGLEITKQEVEEKGGKFHENSAEALNWLRGLDKNE